MPMTSHQPETPSPQNAQVVPAEPKVKSSKMCKLSLCGVSAKAGLAKITDPSCYALVTVDVTGLFENAETTMATFKRGDAVWLYWNDKTSGYPQMYHRPGKITKKVHPTSYMVAFAANDYRRPTSQWHLDRRSHEHHPSDLYPHDLDPGVELRRRRQVWKEEVPPEVQAAWWRSEAERKRANEKLNRDLRPILARMLG